MIIEGKNPVYEALNGEVTIEKLLVLKDAPNGGFGGIIKACREKKIVVQFVDRPALDRLSPTKKHQGIIAVATEFVYSDFEDILQNKSKDLLIIVLDGIDDPHNVGAIVRVADCVGADGIIIPRHRSCGVTDTVVKVSCGATSYVKIAKVANINDALRKMKDAGIMVFAADMDGTDIYKTNLKGDIAVVIGGEGSGVHTLTKKLCDGIISLPQKGKVNSLNASVAAGAMLYEAVRQRNN